MTRRAKQTLLKSRLGKGNLFGLTAFCRQKEFGALRCPERQ